MICIFCDFTFYLLTVCFQCHHKMFLLQLFFLPIATVFTLICKKSLSALLSKLCENYVAING